MYIQSGLCCTLCLWVINPEFFRVYSPCILLMWNFIAIHLTCNGIHLFLWNKSSNLPPDGALLDISRSLGAQRSFISVKDYWEYTIVTAYSVLQSLKLLTFYVYISQSPFINKDQTTASTFIPATIQKGKSPSNEAEARKVWIYILGKMRKLQNNGNKTSEMSALVFHLSCGLSVFLLHWISKSVPDCSLF